MFCTFYNHIYELRILLGDTMIKATIFIALWGAGVTAAEAQGLTVFTCTEQSGGWCESEGQCYKNTEPTDFVFSMVRVPVDGEKTTAFVKFCKESVCGPDWQKEITSYSGDYEVTGHSEIYEIDGKTGFFTQTMPSSSSTLGRVSYTFGYCKLPNKK